MRPAEAPDDSALRRRWPWALLALGLLWSVLIRVPLILNAETHLDSDLAVDGLTLREAVRGHWRWHYPGTPHMGIFPVALSWPQALVWGANPITLVSGGTVAYALLVAATFVLAWRTFGPAVAAWGLVPLAFCSTGTLWLSGRLTGGHLLTAAWHAGAFVLLHRCLTRGGAGAVIALGVWCGLGYYLDTMFLATLAGIIPAAVASWWASGGSRRGACCGLLFLPAFLAGAWPREVGAWLDPHDAYRVPMEPILGRDVLEEHVRLLVLECLPRLIVGRRLPGLQSDPDPSALAGPNPTRSRPDAHPLSAAVTVVGLTLFLWGLGELVVRCFRGRDPAARAVGLGLLISSAAVLAGFVTHRNIFNADNYRYLVDWLVPWPLGFGLAMKGLSRRGAGGVAAAVLCTLLLAGLMSVDTARWYARLGWIDGSGSPVRQRWEDPALAWLEAHRAVDRIVGGYWDVYRLSFLTGGRVRGVPYPIFPDRFPEWSRPPSGVRPQVLIARPSPDGNLFRESAQRSGGRVLYQTRGLSIVSWP